MNTILWLSTLTKNSASRRTVIHPPKYRSAARLHSHNNPTRPSQIDTRHPGGEPVPRTLDQIECKLKTVILSDTITLTGSPHEIVTHTILIPPGSSYEPIFKLIRRNVLEPYILGDWLYSVPVFGEINYAFYV